jgi:hypothetical protein
MEASPLAKLSLELRRKIYGLVVAVEKPVHIFQVAPLHNYEWHFICCKEPSWDGMAGIVNCGCKDEGTRIDAILKTCRQIRDEAIQVMFTSNTILFDPGFYLDLEYFVKSFGTLVQYIRSMILIYNRRPELNADATIKDYSTFCSRATQLRHLKVYCLVPFLSPSDKTLEQYTLDRFRLLSSLQLKTATVSIKSKSSNSSTAMALALEKRAQDMLLSCEDHSSGIMTIAKFRAAQESKQKSAPKLVSSGVSFKPIGY